MFVPVSIRLGAGGEERASYNRIVETSSKFDALGELVADMTAPLTQIAEDLHAQMAAAFATEGATGATGKWAQLSPDYGAWKAARSSAPILVGLRPLHKGTRQHPTRPQTYVPSGLMRRQLLMPLADRATWHIGPKRMLYAPLSNIAGFHETGTSRMPARPPVDVSLTFLRSIDRTFAVWLNGLMEKLGLGGPGSG